ncbi:MAG TPA: phage protease [Bryobacteraceae bacterium]|jgi:phage I-like protein|nr:phage protease [Bryobacteraceae bacterium]
MTETTEKALETQWIRLGVDLSAIDLSEASDDKPVRIPVAVVGSFYKGKQKFSISKADVTAMAENFAKKANGEVVIDYEHASEFPDVAAGGPIPAAGWLVHLDDKPDSSGIVWGEAKFNERARTMLAANEYKYGSPTIDWGSRDKQTGEPQGATLTSFALTNRPVLEQMPAIRLSDAEFSEKEPPNQVKENVMCSEHPKTKMLCPQCDADEIKNLNASDATHQHGPKVLQLSEVTRDAATGRIDVASLNGDTAVSIGVVRAIEQQRVALSEVEAAITAGRITPAQRPRWEKIALSDIESFRELTKDMKSVDLSERGVAGTGAEGASDELQQLNARLKNLAGEKMKADKNLNYAQALKLVASENSELDQRRTQLMRARSKGEE